MSWFKDDSYSFPIFLAVGLHLTIATVGIVAVDFNDNETKQPKKPVIVNATVIDISDTIIGKREAQEKIAKQQAAQKRKNDIAKKALEKQKKQLAQAKQRKVEAAEKAKKIAAEKEKKLAEEKRKADDAKKKQLAEEKRKADDAKKKLLAQEAEEARLAQEAENEKQRQVEAAKAEREQKEQELLRQLEADRIANEERKRQEEAERIAEEKKIADEIAAAEAEKQAAEEAEMVLSISDLINTRVAAVWSRPPSARNGMKAKLRINFFPNGEISYAEVTEGSGDALFDQRTLDAVNKVEKIEELADVDSYVFERNFRQIDLIFNPQDLRN